MSKLDKLSISGIRSFSPFVRETLEFYSPVTLIVGHNGSGKTTIIESLKFMTTGEQPPNTRGGAFVHDPMICSEKEVKAQVKLAFRNVNGVKMICTRSLQLTMKKTARSLKTLDGSLTATKDGERTEISSRCAELDNMMPQFLGVPKAILEYVIFCHQEESLWPLSEPANLKKRFDEIFEAVKYTKALDNIKSLRKEQAVQLKIDSNTLEHLKTDQDRANKVQAQVNDFMARISANQKRLGELDVEIKSILDEKDNWQKSSEEFVEIIANLSKMRQQRSMLHENLSELSGSTTLIDLSDLELDEMQQSFSSDQQQEIIRNHLKTRDELSKELTTTRASTNAKMSEHGRMKAENHAFERQLSQREEIIREASRKHRIRGYDMALDELLVSEFMEKLDSARRQAQSTVERHKRSTKEEENTAQQKAQQIKNAKIMHEQQKATMLAQVNGNELKVATLQRSLDGFEVDEGGLALLQSNMVDLEKRLHAVRKEGENTDWDSKSKQKTAEIQELEKRVDGYNEELANANQQSDSHVRLGILKDYLLRRREAMETLRKANAEKFKNVTGIELSIDTMDSVVREALGKKQDLFGEAEDKLESATRQCSQTETRLHLSRETLKSRQVLADTCKSRLLAVVESVDHYKSELEAYETELKAGNDADNYFRFAQQYFERAYEAGIKEKSCSLCSRSLRSEQDLELYKTVVTASLKKFPDRRQEAQENLREIEERLVPIRNARGTYEEYARLIKNLPQLKKEVTLHSDTLNTSDGTAKECQQQVAALKEDIADLEYLRRPIADISRYQKEITNLEIDVATAESQSENGQGMRPLSEIQADVSRENERTRALNRSLQSLNNEREAQRRHLHTLESQWRDSQMRFSEAGHQLKEKCEISNRIEELQATCRSLRQQSQAAEQSARDLVANIAAADEELAELRDRAIKQEAILQRTANELESNCNALQSVENEIERWTKSGGVGALARCEQELSSMSKRIEELDRAIRDLNEIISTEEKKQMGLHSQQRNIADNLRLRRMQRQLKDLEASIKENEQRNAERDRDRITEVTQRLNKKHERLFAEKASLVGETKQMDDQLQRYISELEGEYKDVHDHYRRQLIKVRTTGAANKDLERYGKALDSAIMSYHALKMKEINGIIDELWKKTYAGTDVDTIMICSDHDTAKSASSTGTARSTNYRVVMMKQSVELDMRGRCSAGQKVLACIIIRLALAECFGVQFGVIALDEPTTNLDRDNVQSLAQSLASIVRVRQQQANFQLIVITHDEEFLRYMHGSDWCDYYYRVGRNNDQTSVIERQLISEVM